MKRLMASSMILTLTALGAPHAAIRIGSDADFTAANGVVNPGAAGTPDDPFLIEGWEVSSFFSGPAIEVAHTTKAFVVRNCLCLASETGIALLDVGDAGILDNTISAISGQPGFFPGGDGRPGVGIRIEGSRNVSVDGTNHLSFIYGGAGAAGLPLSGEGGAGGKGGDAYSVLVRGSEGVLLRGIDTSAIYGGAGGAGVIGLFFSSSGGAGGKGGDAHGIVLEEGHALTLSGNRVVGVLSGAGGAGAAGWMGWMGAPGGAGGAGASAGDAFAIEARDARALHLSGNSVFGVFGGAGGAGGAGALSGGAGGRAGDGGSAYALRCERSEIISTADEKYGRIWSGAGGAGAAGGVGLFVAPGGKGGDGGKAGEAEGVSLDGASKLGGDNLSVTDVLVAMDGLGGMGALGFPGFAPPGKNRASCREAIGALAQP